MKSHMKLSLVRVIALGLAIGVAAPVFAQGNSRNARDDDKHENKGEDEDRGKPRRNRDRDDNGQGDENRNQNAAQQEALRVQRQAEQQQAQQQRQIQGEQAREQRQAQGANERQRQAIEVRDNQIRQAQQREQQEREAAAQQERGRQQREVQGSNERQRQALEVRENQIRQAEAREREEQREYGQQRDGRREPDYRGDNDRRGDRDYDGDRNDRDYRGDGDRRGDRDDYRGDGDRRGDRDYGRGEGRRGDRLSQRESQQLFERQQERATRYRRDAIAQQAIERQRIASLQQHNRMRQYRYQQRYWDRQRELQARWSSRRYDNDPYFYTPASYRYLRGGRYYQINNYAADMLRQAIRLGYEEGARAGEADRYDGWRGGYRDNFVYLDANLGYDGYYVDQDEYNYYFREGFRRGYEDAYGRRYRYGRYDDGDYAILPAVLGVILALEAFD
jgi:hypothetical protein